MKIYLSKCWRQSYCVELGLIIFLVVFLVIFCIWSHDREDYIMILLVLFQILVLVGLLFASKRTATYAIIEPDEIHSYSFFSKKLCTVVTTTKPVYYAIFKTPVEGRWRDQFIACLLYTSLLARQKSDNLDMRFTYNTLGIPVALWYNGSEYYYVRNLQNDIIGLIDSTGEWVVEYSYDAWGKILNISGSLAATVGQNNPLRYRGYYYDNETGLYYVSSRYYHPELGRWISADDILDDRAIHTLNLFPYCGNDPVNNQDSNGHIFGAILGAVMGGIIGGIGGALSAAVDGKSVLAGAVTGAATGAAVGGICGFVADLAVDPILLAATTVICGVVTAAGNAVNQYWNYGLERDAQLEMKRSGDNFTVDSSKFPRSSNGKLASECESFAEYIDVKSVAISGILGAIFAPIGIGANIIVDKAFSDGLKTGAVNKVAQVVASFVTGGNISILQAIIDLF